MLGEIWNLIIIQPVINLLIVLSHYLFGSFGLAIIALTIVVNGLMYPLTLKQLRATKAMQALQPKLLELRQKYAKDRDKLAKEQMRLYKESGVSPAGCLLPMLVQLPIWIALFWAIIKLLAVTPEDFLGLSKYLYSWSVVYSMVPLESKFLGLNLAEPNFSLAILVGGTMWLQQKMTMTPTADPKQESMSRMMLWMMPLVFAFICLSLPSGLALYWVTSSVIRIGMEYFATGWGALIPSMAKKPVTRDKRYKRRIAQVEEAPSGGADIVEPSSAQEEGLSYEKPGDKRQDRKRGYPTRLRAIRREPRGGRGHCPKRR
ncbi:MAG: YidC/Oxa1 family membrane protein insertase [Dehalococcoidales bacterium]|nr:YidC/Oxa1 family membrane protein insertase [Dehalococcoidales bacterium]